MPSDRDPHGSDGAGGASSAVEAAVSVSMRELALLQAGVPLAVSLWLLFGRSATWGDVAARVIGGWVLLLGVALAGLWLALPLSTLLPLAASMLIASFVAVRRAQFCS